MTIHQARQLQAALRHQHEERLRVISVANPDELVAAATEYIAATDRCYTIACEIAGQRPEARLA